MPLFHVGLSSGGHLSRVLAYHSHPIAARGLLVGYAPLNANRRADKLPAGKPDYETVGKQDFYHGWPVGGLQSEAALPRVPVFLIYALTDRSVLVQHALRFIELAAKEEIDLDVDIFGAAPHGSALRDRTGTHVAWPVLAGNGSTDC